MVAPYGAQFVNHTVGEIATTRPVDHLEHEGTVDRTPIHHRPDEDSLVTPDSQ